MFVPRIISNYKRNHKKIYPFGKDYIPITACIIPINTYNNYCTNYIIYSNDVRLVVNYVNVNTLKSKILSEIKYLESDKSNSLDHDYFYRYIELHGCKYRFKIPYDKIQGNPKLISITKIEKKKKRRRHY